MKNMKVSLKLITGFLAVIALTVAVGVSGIIGLRSMSDAAESMYADMAMPMSDLGLATEYFQRIRVQMRNAVIYTGDAENLQTVGDDLLNRMDNFESKANIYKDTILAEDGKRVFAEMMNTYENTMKPGVMRVLESAKSGMAAGRILEEMTETTKAADVIAEHLRTLTQVRLQVMSDANDGTTETFNTLLAVVVVAIALAIGASLFLAFYISGLISKPLRALAAFMKLAGTTGEITMSERHRAEIDAFGKQKDEIGETIASAAVFFEHANAINSMLEKVADGDLTGEIAPLSDKDTLGLSLQKMSGNLNRMFGKINSSASQVSSGANLIADGAQALASGSTEQAASVEELSSSIAEINDMTKSSTKSTTIILDDVRLAGQHMDECMEQMGEMTAAMRIIDEKSQNISKTAKVIDDIAFQTNILALNAAVEAARAGQHGRGFAVVAEEVRNLASKSAEAAKETASLIEDSTRSVADGGRIVEKVNGSLNAVGEISKRNAEQIAELQAVSVQQSAAMEQINIGVDQIAQVVQQNSATAEESAASSQEMSCQAAVLQQLAAQFILKDGADAEPRAFAPPAAAPYGNRIAAASAAWDRDTVPALGDSRDFGKYSPQPV